MWEGGGVGICCLAPSTTRRINSLFVSYVGKTIVWFVQLCGMASDPYPPDVQAEWLRAPHCLPGQGKKYDAVYTRRYDRKMQE